VLGVFAALAVLAAAGIYAAVHSLSSGLPIHIAVQQCKVNATGSVTLDPEQMANAATVAAVGIRRRLPKQAVVVALAAALQESKLQNLSGGDRDSIGLFQQRPSQGWGTPDQIADPRYAAQRFYTALVKIKGWQQLRVADAAQSVQHSADGELYQRWSDESQILANALTGDATGAVACTITDKPAQHGQAAVDALAQGLAADWGNLNTVNANGLMGVELAVPEARTGWQYAHWLVSHAIDRNIKSVSFGDQIWTAKDGGWSRAGSAGPAAAERVVAEVYS
jgi:hypothetical protein